MMFSLAQVRCFVAVADELHFGRAAARLHMTQPPLSRQIQLLEHRLGVKLLDRTSRVVQLLPAGVVFLEEGRRMLAQAEHAAASARRAAGGEVGSISLGFTAASGTAVLPHILLAYRRHFPEVKVVLQEMVSLDQQEALRTGQIDLGFMRPPAEKEFATQVVHREGLVAAMLPDHPLAAKRELRFADLHGQELVMYSPHQARYFYDLLAGFAGREAVTAVFTQHVTQVHSMVALASAGLGLAVIPESATHYGGDRLVFRPIRTVPAKPVELIMAWAPRNDSPTLREFVALATERQY